MTYEDAIAELRTVRYCSHRLIEINEELEVLNHQKTGLARPGGPELTKEQQKSKWPMPTYQHQYSSPLAILEAITAKEQELHHYQKRLLDLRWTEILSLEDQNILWDLYIYYKKVDDVATEYGYSKWGLYKHLKSIVKPLI